MGFKEKDIVLMGDSAGANAALALTKYLVEHQTPRDAGSGLPGPPGSLVLLSPWTDISESFKEATDPRSSQVRFPRYDSITGLHKWPCVYFATVFVGARPEDREEASSNSYISPASPEVLGLSASSSRTVSFKGYPRTWIDVGGMEVLLDQVRRLRDGMVEDMGEELVCYNEVEGATHDYLVPEIYEPERTETFTKISRWLEEGWDVEDVQ
jgi:acetyl esterase/lipase